MANLKSQSIAFSACALAAALSFGAAGVITFHGPDMPIVFQVIFDVAIFACVGVFLRNLGAPIFAEPAMTLQGGRMRVILLAVAYICAFQVIVAYGFYENKEYLSIYVRYMIILQIVNLFWLWTLICGLVGQSNFNPFFVALMKNPLGAIGYALGSNLLRPYRPGASNDRRHDHDK